MTYQEWLDSNKAPDNEENFGAYLSEEEGFVKYMGPGVKNNYISSRYEEEKAKELER